MPDSTPSAGSKRLAASDRASAPLLTDPALLARLSADLRSADYTVERAEEALGTLAADALRRENPIPARLALRGRRDPLAVLYSLFTLGAIRPRAEVEPALPSLGVDGAIALGLLAAPPAGPGHREEEDAVRALVDLSPYSATDDLGAISWWIASDLSEIATGRALEGEHVLGVGGASLTLARITPREPVGRALDIGCGGGIQALHLARHAEHVVATDLSQRALDFAAFNAALNEIALELRQGSLAEPVHGEVFDLIVSNPPFVITPRTAAEGAPAPAAGSEQPTGERWTYRDGGRAGDALLGELLADLPSLLAPDGRAVMLANWEISEDDWRAHPEAWLRPAAADGVDALVIQRESEDPAQYAETWARDGGITVRDAAWEGMQEAWLADFDSRGAHAIGFGYIALHRPSTRRPGILTLENVVTTGSGHLGAHLAQTLDRIDALAALTDEELLASRPAREADVIERRHQEPGAWDPMLIEIVQGAGFGRTVPADQMLAAAVGALDGSLTLDQTIGAICALTDADPEEARERLLPRIRELIRTGVLHL